MTDEEKRRLCAICGREIEEIPGKLYGIYIKREGQMYWACGMDHLKELVSKKLIGLVKGKGIEVGYI